MVQSSHIVRGKEDNPQDSGTISAFITSTSTVVLLMASTAAVIAAIIVATISTIINGAGIEHSSVCKLMTVDWKSRSAEASLEIPDVL